MKKVISLLGVLLMLFSIGIVNTNAADANAADTSAVDANAVDTSAVVVDGDGEPGRILVLMSPAAKELTWTEMLPGVEIERSWLSGHGPIYITSYVVLELADKSAENVQRVIGMLRDVPGILSAEPDDLLKHDYEPGTVLISLNPGAPSWGTLFEGFEIESTRAIYWTGNARIFEVKFTEKTKEIVKKAVHALSDSPYVEYIEPNWYNETCVVPYYALKINYGGAITDLDEKIDVAVHLERGKGLSDMLGWDDVSRASGELAYYLKERNGSAAREVLQDVGNDGVNIWTPDCLIVWGVKIRDLETIAKHAVVKSVERFDERGVDGKLLPLLQAVLKDAQPDDWIEVTISYSGKYPSLDEMPSWGVCDRHDADSVDEMRGKAQQEYGEALRQLKDDFYTEIFDGVAYKDFGIQGLFIAAIQAKDVEKVAARDSVRDIDYFCNSIEEPAIDPPADPEPVGTDYREKLAAQYPMIALGELADFDVTEHTDANGAVDWALVKARCGEAAEQTVCYRNIIGGRKIWLGGVSHAPFLTGYGVYDASSGRFTDVEEVDFERYDGLCELWQSLDLSDISPLRVEGDANGDGKCDIVDATHIQRRLAEMVARTGIDEKAADVDGDGRVSIVDATVIQRSLADLCEIGGSAKA